MVRLLRVARVLSAEPRHKLHRTHRVSTLSHGLQGRHRSVRRKLIG